MAIKLKLIHFNSWAESVSIIPHMSISPVLMCNRNVGVGHLCNLPQPNMSVVATSLTHLHPAFKNLFKKPLNNQLKSKQDHHTLQLFLRLLSWVEGAAPSAPDKLCYMHLKWSAVWACPCLLFHYGIVTPGLVCSPNTINKVSAAHQYCYLHRVLISSPYNHKMLIAPINSQSVCALVWPPWALKVSVKMNCSLILLQEKIFSQDNTVCYSEIKRG